MAWKAPMSQFSWTKAAVYGLVGLIVAALLQAYMVLPGTLRWISEERRRREQPRLLEEYRAENARLMRAILELQRQVAEREEALRKTEERVKGLEAARSEKAGEGKKEELKGPAQLKRH